MKRLMAFALTLCLVGLLFAPGSVDASTTSGSGGGRSVELVDVLTDGNLSVAVPAPSYFANYTEQNYSVVFSNANWTSQTYVVNFTVNGTTYSTGEIVVATNVTATGYIVIPADAHAVENGLNLTVELFDASTYTLQDVAWLEINAVDVYGGLTGTVVDLMIVVVTILVIMMIFKFLLESTSGMEKKLK